MCGIAGFVGTGTADDLRRMTDALAHRGPDGEGFQIDPDAPVFLGHRRLAILDADGGSQPMWNEDGQVGVVYNGEIYNHADLRHELEGRGHHFVSDHSDTEVLVHGYEQWGEDLPRRLNGMFAFALLDRKRRRLFLARDRFGEKPLYYSVRPDCFAFASELTALAEHPRVSRSLSMPALQKLLGWGYLPAPHAILEGSKKLPNGHWLLYDIANGTLRTAAYWRFRLQPDAGLGDGDEERLADELENLLAEAARRRLMSDVPLGVFLSGGIDSSTILASLTRFLPADSISSFTVGFTEPSFDESPYARTVAEHLGTRHHECKLDLDVARDLIPQVLGRLDEPLGDSSLLPTYLLSAFAREKVTVALSGDGGDELFAGYDPFQALGLAQLYSRVMPRMGHRALRRLVDLLPISHANMSLDFKLRRSLMGLSYPQTVWLPVWMAPLEPGEIAELCQTEVHPEDIYSEAIELWASRPELSPVDRALEFFTTFYLPDDILTKVDRAAMMCSLETRAVFLDNDLVAFCERLPSRFKFYRGERKVLLKKVARRFLPRYIVERKKKGFGIPLAKWLREMPTKPPLAAIEGTDTRFTALAFDEHRKGKADNRLFLWNWLTVQSLSERLAHVGRQGPL